MTYLKLPLTIVLLLLASAATVQGQIGNTAYEELVGNQVKATFSNAGNLFYDGDDAGYAVPYFPGMPEQNTIYSASLWLGGMDESGTLRFAGNTYRSTPEDSDFFSGPILTSTGAATMGREFDRIWTVRRSDILRLIEDYDDDNVIDDPIPDALRAWPGAGNPFFEEANGFALPEQDLAPFFDRNGNGAYEPNLGEYPVIGEEYPNIIPEQLLWCVYNDLQEEHNSFFFDPLGVEVQLTAYAFNCTDNPMLNTAIFTRHKVIKRTPGQLSDFRAGFWMDTDLGCYTDDFNGCDSTLHTAYAYNKDAIDGQDDNCSCPQGINSYCTMPPVHAVTLLNQDMGSFMYTAITAVNFPVNLPQDDPYALLHGRWSDGTPISVGGVGYDPGNPNITNFTFHSSPTDPTGWSMLSEDLPEIDTRIVMSTASTTLEQDEAFIFDALHSYHRGEGLSHIENVDFALANIPGLEQFYTDGFLNACTQQALCTDDCAWPGDVNNDGQVYADDLLYAGVALSQAADGPARELFSTAWAPQFADNWAADFNSGFNYKHADCNGDGSVSALDLAVFDQNYGLTRSGFEPPAPESCQPGTPLLYLDPDKDTLDEVAPSALSWLFRVPFSLGTMEEPVEDIHGISFSVLYDTALLQTNIIATNQSGFTSSFLGDPATGMASRIKFLPELGRVDIAITRTDGQNQSGFGQLGRFGLQYKGGGITNNIDGLLRIPLEVVNVRAINAEEETIAVGCFSDTIYVKNVRVLLNEDSPLSGSRPLRLFPNPSRGAFSLDWGQAPPASFTLLVYNARGQLQYRQHFRGPNAGIQLPKALPGGVYWVKALTEDGQVATGRLVLAQ